MQIKNGAPRAEAHGFLERNTERPLFIRALKGAVHFAIAQCPSAKCPEIAEGFWPRMYKRHRAGVLKIFFITTFILGLFTTYLFAATKLDSEMQELEKAEKMERRVAPEVIIRPNLEYKAKNFRSPFWSPFHVKAGLSAVEKKAGGEGEVKVVEPEKPLPLLKVQGVIWGGSFPQAIINDKVVKIGDTVGGVRILSIDKENIGVFFEERKYKIPSPAAGAITTTSNQKP